MNAAIRKETQSTSHMTYSANQIQMSGSPEKQGGKCCGCCCDYKRAVIACASVILAAEACIFLFAVTGGFLGVLCSDDGYTYYYDYSGECNEHFKPVGIMEAVFSLVSVLLGIATIWGASNYYVIPVGLNVFWMFASFIAGVIVRPIYCRSWDDQGQEYTCNSIGVGGIVFGLAIIALFAYPHVMFIVEVRKDILSRETYPREEFSCCCISGGAASNSDIMARTSTIGPAPTVSVVISESILPIGSKQIKKVETAPDGTKTITYLNEMPADQV